MKIIEKPKTAFAHEAFNVISKQFPELKYAPACFVEKAEPADLIEPYEGKIQRFTGSVWGQAVDVFVMVPWNSEKMELDSEKTRVVIEQPSGHDLAVFEPFANEEAAAATESQREPNLWTETGGLNRSRE